MTTSQKRLGKALRQANSEIARYLSTIGARGGSVKSPAKARSSAVNGGKGGRPKGKSKPA